VDKMTDIIDKFQNTQEEEDQIDSLVEDQFRRESTSRAPTPSIFSTDPEGHSFSKAYIPIDFRR